MMLSGGTRLGSYEIAAAIGAGGMGEVYRARDTRLDRDVAIKVLPADLAHDRERLARFEREAKLLASLNHPNIAAIFGMEVGAPLVGALDEDRERAGTRPAPAGRIVALVMELVEGEDLAERLRRGAIPIDESIAIAKQIAEGLEEAHEHGIIHRDLKPANVKVTPEGKVKILDFGLAKALEGDSAASEANSQLSDSPTMSRHMTEAGMIMGTAAYMSPEQARGKAVDKRADIWSFGVVLFEMLSGQRLFAADNVSDTLAAVLREEIPWARLPKETSSGVIQTLRLCLTRDPQRRLRSTGDVRLLLDEVIAGAANANRSAVEPNAPSRPLRFTTAPLWLAAGVLITGLVAWGLGVRRSPATPMLFRAVTSFAGVQAQPALSPDGRSVAFVSNRDGDYDIYVGLVSGGALVKITHDPNLESRPSWSPDGAAIAYARLNEWGLWDIWQIPALGGTPRRLILNAADPAWSRDGRSLAYADRTTGAIWICDAAGHNPRQLTRRAADSFGRDGEPRFSPDGRSLSFVSRPGGPYGELKVLDLDSGRMRQLTDDQALAASPAWSPDSESIYFASSRNGTMNVWRIAAAGGKPEQITAGQGDDAQLDVSADGRRIVFATFREKLSIAHIGLGPAKEPGSPTRLITDPARHQLNPVYSPDGKHLAYFSNLKGVEREGIWVARADGADAAQLVQDSMLNIFPRWTPDSERLFYTAMMSTQKVAASEYRRVSRSGGAPETVLSGVFDENLDVGADGRLLFQRSPGKFESHDPETLTPQTLTLSSLSERGWLGRWSPDGRAFAYVVTPVREGDPDAGLWVEEFGNPPRQVFQGWVIWYSTGLKGEIVLQEGKPDLNGVLWKIGWDGSKRERLSSLRLLYSYVNGPSGPRSPDFFDIAPDGRRLAFNWQEVLQANIGLLENEGPDRR